MALKSDKNNGYGTWRPIGYICLITSRLVLLRLRNVSDKVALEVKTLILRPMIFSKMVPFMRLCIPPPIKLSLAVHLHPLNFLWLFTSTHQTFFGCLPPPIKLSLALHFHPSIFLWLFTSTHHSFFGCSPPPINLSLAVHLHPSIFL